MRQTLLYGAQEAEPGEEPEQGDSLQRLGPVTSILFLLDPILYSTFSSGLINGSILPL